MSLENIKHEYHLTINGWVEGSLNNRPFNSKHVEKPEDTYLTLVFRSRQSDSFSDTDMWYEKLWASEDTKKLAELKDRYGEFPKEYIGTEYVKPKAN